MTGNNHVPPVPGDDDEISLLDIANTVLRNWRVVVLVPVLLALAVGTWSVTRDRMYAATASFMPQSPENRGQSSTAVLAQQLGVNFGSDRPGQSPQFYIELLRSRTLLREAVEAAYEVPEGEGTWRGTLVDRWELAEKGGPLPPWRHAVDRLNDAMGTVVNRETGTVQLTVALDHPLLAELVTERLLDLLNAFNLEIRRNRALEENRFLTGRIEEAQTALRQSEDALQEFLRQNREFRNSPTLLFEHDRLQRHILMRQEVHASLLRTQEQARFDGVRDTPMLAVIDHPSGTAEPRGRGAVSRALLAFTVGLVFSLLIAFVAEYVRRSRESQDPDYREFEGLARQVWHDLRRPHRWLRRGAGSPPAGWP